MKSNAQKIQTLDRAIGLRTMQLRNIPQGNRDRALVEADLETLREIRHDYATGQVAA